jgi:hypothetical protein
MQPAPEMGAAVRGVIVSSLRGASSSDLARAASCALKRRDERDAPETSACRDPRAERLRQPKRRPFLDGFAMARDPAFGEDPG